MSNPVHTTQYFYGPERQRILRKDWVTASATGNAGVIAHTVGSAEISTRAGATNREVRRHLGTVIRYQSLTNGVVGASNERYVFTDAQGSPHRITNEWGITDAEGRQWFAAFGKRASSVDGTPLPLNSIYNFTSAHTKRGYTGHEHADAVGLIHMNGRMYDPLIGRFIQADPIVQDPMNLQSLNRYSYVLNNPFAYTDPTGYWGREEQGYLRTVVAIVIVATTGYYISYLGATGVKAAGIAAAGGAAAGAVATGTLRGAVIGALSGAIGQQIGQVFTSGSYQSVASHAVLGGITSELSGGKFGHGFVSAGAGSALAPYMKTGNTFGDGVSHAMVGGTVSVISGGKFANGAVTAAFSYALGQVADSFETATSPSAGVSLIEMPDAVKIEAKNFDTEHDAVRAAGAVYGPEGVRRQQEPQLGITKLGEGNWGYLTPGWGPVGALRVNFKALVDAYAAAGLSYKSWMHGHFDSQMNFSAADIDHVWKRPGSTYLVNKGGETRVLTNRHLQREFRSLSMDYKKTRTGRLAYPYWRQRYPGRSAVRVTQSIVYSMPLVLCLNACALRQDNELAAQRYPIHSASDKSIEKYIFKHEDCNEQWGRLFDEWKKDGGFWGRFERLELNL